MYKLIDHINGRQVHVWYVQDREQAKKALVEAANADHTALDFETTALSPYDSETDSYVRLTSIAVSSSKVYVLDHKRIGAFDKWAHKIANAAEHFVFNISFEGAWFDAALGAAGRDMVRLKDVGLMRKSVMGGGPLSLKLQAKWDMKFDLPKEEQLSDWSADELTDGQLLYAGRDAAVTWWLGDQWASKMDDDHWRGFWPMNNCWRAVNEMQETGFLMDPLHHRKLIKMWEHRKRVSYKTLRKFTPESVIKNIDSKKQISDFLRATLDDAAVAAWPKTGKTGQLQTTRDILRQMSYRAPYPFSRWLAALMVYTRASKYLSTYGEKLLTSQALAGRVYPRFNIAQAVTCRFSSSGAMNAQNLPRAPLVRRSFIAPVGFKLVIADYSGIEMRVLAEVSGDAQLIHDVIYGDVHAESAIAIFNVDAERFKKMLEAKDPVAKEMRSKAKAFTFQLAYGASPAALSVVLRCTDDEAAMYVERWAARYKRAYNYRQLMFEKMRYEGGFLPVCSGRTIFVPRADRTMPVAANYPIQGAAADLMYNALVDIEKRLYFENIPAWMQGTVHDEILLLCEDNEKTIARTREALEAGMRRGWEQLFPGSNTDNLLESAVGWNWSAKP